MTGGILLILDGWGIGPAGPANAITAADTPTLDRIVKNHLLAQLTASGTDVGMEPGVVGNSETGHITIGAGRTIDYDSLRVAQTMNEGALADTAAFAAVGDRLKRSGGVLHLVGLCSSGAIHSALEHVDVLLDSAKHVGVPAVMVHAITDGRDVSDGTAARCLQQLQSYLDGHGLGVIATVTGRGHAMPKGSGGDGVAATCRAITDAHGARAGSVADALESFSDQHVPPTVLDTAAHRPAPIGPDDEILLFNFRSDRTQQLADAIADRLGPHRVTTLARYDTRHPLQCLIDRADASGGLSDQLELRGLRTVRIAEPEKFDHVTYYLDGRDRRDRPLDEHVAVPGRGGERTYLEHPETNLDGVVDEIGRAAARHEIALVVANLHNIDVIGHTGDLAATILATEAVDRAVSAVLDHAAVHDRWVLLVGDHGNAEEMTRAGVDGVETPYGGHTTNSVPLVLVPADPREGPPTLPPTASLADVTPTILALLEGSGIAPGHLVRPGAQSRD